MSLNTTRRQIRRTVRGGCMVAGINRYVHEVPAEMLIPQELREDWLAKAYQESINSSHNSLFPFENLDDTFTKIAQQNIASKSRIESINDEFDKFDNYSLIIEEEDTGNRIPNPPKPKYLDGYEKEKCPYEELLFVCSQSSALPWREIESELEMKAVVKIGEGSFGEVYRTRYAGCEVALKVFPFRRNLDDDEPQVNGSDMAHPASILVELVITKLLSSLSQNSWNSTRNFVQHKKTWITEGLYPEKFTNAWNSYKKRNKKDCLNEPPSKYSQESRLYIAMALETGGNVLEKFEINGNLEVLSIFSQVALSLAIAEDEFQFEHRDLHWGNILIRKDTKKKMEILEYLWNGKKWKIKSAGIMVTIIDFTNSRLSNGTDEHVYMDLSMDKDLFNQDGPDVLQCNVYKEMKELLQNEWSRYCPRTNCCWLEYLADKVVNGYEPLKMKPKRLTEKDTMFQRLKNVKNYNSAGEFLLSDDGQWLRNQCFQEQL